jgi:hypothetical protein
MLMMAPRALPGVVRLLSSSVGIFAFGAEAFEDGAKRRRQRRWIGRRSYSGLVQPIPTQLDGPARMMGRPVELLAHALAPNQAKTIAVRQP